MTDRGQPDPTTDRGETILDVTALAVAQMRAARAAVDAKADYHRAREAWLVANQAASPTLMGSLPVAEYRRLRDEAAAAGDASRRAARELYDARRASAAANRAYQQACGDALADALAPLPPVEQPGLFG